MGVSATLASAVHFEAFTPTMMSHKVSNISAAPAGSIM